MPDEEFVDLESAARRIMGEQLSMPVCVIEPIVGGGKLNAVFRVECGRGVFAVRLRPTVEVGQNYAKEAWCLERAAEVGILVPTARAHGEIGRYSYIVEDFVPGLPGHSEGIDVLRVWERLGDYAAKANGIAVEGYGHRMSVTEPGHFLDCWQEWISELFHQAFRDDYWVEAGVFPARHVEILKGILERCGDVSAVAGLCHIDIGEWNTILANGSIEALYLLDWDLSVAGPVPQYQVARALVNAPNWEAFDAFIRGYGLTRSTLDDMHEDVSALTVLEMLSGVRWAQDNWPGDVGEDSRSARSITYELFGDRLR